MLQTWQQECNLAPDGIARLVDKAYCYPVRAGDGEARNLSRFGIIVLDGSVVIGLDGIDGTLPSCTEVGDEVDSE